MDTIIDSPVEKADDNEHARWVQEIKLYEREVERWEKDGKKITQRFKAERGSNESRSSRFNILWSNVQTLMPALYARGPKPDIERRFKDDDDLGRVASDVLERCITYFVSTHRFDAAMKEIILDRLLPGRGLSWVRYEPHFRDSAIKGNPEVKGAGPQTTEDVYAEENEPLQEVHYEEVCFDYVHWRDFGHNVCRTWEEVYAGWRIVYLTRAELVKRFGKVGNKVPLNYSPKGLKDEKIGEYLKKAIVYEIWDKVSRQVIWLHKDHGQLLDVRDDPLELVDFFPFPEPLYATLANDSLIPTPDYNEYIDQARELDNLTGRIDAIQKALKVAGVYDASAEGLERLLSEGLQNQLIPVVQWAAYGEKGGLKGAIQFLPLAEISDTLLRLFETREKVKQDLYEITGISDIIRGQTQASETATAQQIKGQFATLRLSSMQDNVQRFARDMVQLSTQIIAKHFSIDTIKKISGVKLLTNQEKSQIQMQMQQAAMQAQATQQPPPPIPGGLDDLLSNPTWEEVEALLRDDAMLGFRVDIETDSTIRVDEDADKKSRMEFIEATSNFMREMAQVSDPNMLVLMGKMLLFGVRGFKIGKDLESTFKLTLSKMEKAAKEPKEPKPDPEMIKAQAQVEMMKQQQQLAQQESQARIALEQQKQQGEANQKAMEFELEKQKSTAELNLETHKQLQEMIHKEKELKRDLAAPQ